MNYLFLARYAVDNGMDISFIEEMPLGDVGHWRGDTYYGADSALQQLQKHFELIAQRLFQRRTGALLAGWGN